MLAGLMIAKHPERYGFTDLNYQEPLAYDLAEIDSVTDVDVIARLAGSDYETIKQLNPELKRWSTPPDSNPYQVRLPVGAGAAFAERYAQLPENQRVNFVAVTRFKKGDTPGAIARRYGVRTDELLRFNKAARCPLPAHWPEPADPAQPGGRQDVAGRRCGKSWHDDEAPAANPANAAPKAKRCVPATASGRSPRRFNVSEKQLRTWNSLGGKEVLKPGQKLAVASGSSRPAASGTAGSKAVSARVAATDTRKVVYQVRTGDTLWEISRQFDVATQQILDWNKLSHNAILRPGQRLTLLVKGSPQG